MPLLTPSPTPYAAQAPQSPELAQALQQMRARPQTPVGATADLIAAALDTFGRQGAGQAKGQGDVGPWTGVDGKPSGDWFDSPLGQRIGALFGLGRSAPAQPPASGGQAAPATPSDPTDPELAR